MSKVNLVQSKAGAGSATIVKLVTTQAGAGGAALAAKPLTTAAGATGAPQILTMPAQAAAKTVLGGQNILIAKQQVGRRPECLHGGLDAPKLYPWGQFMVIWSNFIKPFLLPYQLSTATVGGKQTIVISKPGGVAGVAGVRPQTSSQIIVVTTASALRAIQASATTSTAGMQPQVSAGRKRSGALMHH